jgi:hypothetical protein
VPRSRPTPPEPGTAAYAAEADQYNAALADVRRIGLRLTGRGAALVGPGGPWAAALLDSVAESVGRPRRVCATIAAAVGPIPMFVVHPGLLTCESCTNDLLTGLPSTCSQCGRNPTEVDPLRAVAAQRLHVLARGRLCPSCLYAEQNPHR